MYLIANQERFKRELKSFVDQKKSLLDKEDSSFHSDIQAQFEEYARSKFVDNVTRDLAISTEDAIIVIENLNVDGYLNV